MVMEETSFITMTAFIMKRGFALDISIYCSPTHLKYVVGDADSRNIKIQDYGEIPLPEGGMINGIITDENIVTNFFLGAGRDFGLFKSPVWLVIDNNNILTRNMEVPPVAEAKVLDFVRAELDQRGNEAASDVYDFTVLNPKTRSGGVSILAVGVGRPLLESYQRVLEGAGFDLHGINIGVNCLIKLSRFLPVIHHAACILAIVDGRMLSLTLFSGGEYRISNKYRLVNPEGTAEWHTEIGNNLSSMIQFNKGLRTGHDISAAYVAGPAEDAIKDMGERDSYLGIDIRPLQLQLEDSLSLSGAAQQRGDFQAANYLLNIGNLLKK
jgi:hypothetical protein